MSAASTSVPLDTVFTDEDWIDDISFYIDDLFTPEDWAGCQADMHFVGADGVTFALSSDGGGLIMLTSGVGIRVPMAAMRDRVPGSYDFELRKHLGEAREAVLVGKAVIAQGKSTAVGTPIATAPAAGGENLGGMKVVRGVSGLRVVRNGGIRPGVITNDQLLALISPLVQEEVAARLPVIGDVQLTNLLYVSTAAADTLIADVLDVMDGGVPRVYPNDGRFKITGNAIDGYRLLKGPSATSVGAQSVTVRVSNPAARNGPHHDTVFSLQAMAADRYMVGLTRIRPNSGNNLVAAAGTERKMSVFVYGAPQFMTNRYRFHYSGFASTEGGNSPQETVLPGNDTVIHGVWAIIGAAIVNGAVLGGVRYRLTFGGANGVTIASGANGPWTDEANFLSNVAKEGHVAVVTEYSTAAGQNQIPNARIQKHRGERIWGAAAGVSLEAMLDNLAAPSTAALDTTYGLVTQPQFYGPDNATFKGWEGKPVALVLPDSIGESRQEYSGSADARGNLGVLRRWLDADDATHQRTPHYMIGMPGAGSQRELTTNALKRWDNLDQLTTWNGGLPPFTVVLDQLAQNDLNATFANMLANHKGAVTRVKARYPGVKVVAWGVLPRATSTDYYATRANQTRASGNEWATPTDTWGNGFKWQLEAAREALLDGELSGYISTKPAWYDASYPGTWAPATVTSLAQSAGTDGVATYSQVVLAQMPYVSDVVRWGAAFAGVGIVTDVAANPGGGWLATLDRNTNTVVAAAGSAVLIPPTNDGVHPQSTEIVRHVAAIPQSEKAKLAA